MFAYVSTPAFAFVDIKALISELLAQQQQLGYMQVEAKGEKEKEAALVAESRQLKINEKRIQREATEWQMDNAANEQQKETWSGMGCVANKRTTDIDLAKRCNAIADKINTSTNRLQPWGERLIREKKQNESAQAALSSKTFENAKRQKVASASINDLTRRIAAIQAFLSAQCTSIPKTASDEAVKHSCGNIQFDGAAPNLPPCETDACKKYDAMRTRQ
jgi:hypothetical protein